MTETHDLSVRAPCGCAPCQAAGRGYEVVDVGDFGALAFEMDWSQHIDTILDSPVEKIGSMPGIGAVVSYSFMETAPSDYAADSDVVGFEPFNETMRDATRSAFDVWSANANITFVETAGDDAMIRLGSNDQTGTAGYAYLPSGGSAAGISSDIWLNNDLSYMLSPTVGTYGYETILHEIGHALGLVHPFSGDSILDTSLDNTANTIMSYTDVGVQTSIGPLDIEAVKYLYGTTDGSALVLGNLEIGGAGDDTLSGTSGTNYLHGQAGADYIALGDGADGSYAGSGADTVLGEGGDDLIYGNTGLDLLLGGGGDDTLFGGQNTGDVAPFRTGTDTLSGGDGLDVLYGNYGADLLSGGASADTLYGGQDDDTLAGGGGSDYLFGNLGNDVLVGGDGVDVFVLGSGQGADTVSDFDLTSDFLRINGGANGITSGADALTLLSDVDGTAVLDLGGGNTVTISGLSSSDLRSFDFWIA